MNAGFTVEQYCVSDFSLEIIRNKPIVAYRIMKQNRIERSAEDVVFVAELMTYLRHFGVNDISKIVTIVLRFWSKESSS